MGPTNFAPSLGTFWKLIEANGHDPEPVFRGLGVDPAVIRDPSARVSYVKVQALWTWMSTEIKDPCIGLRVAGYWHPSASGALGYAWLASSSLRTAIGRLLRYTRILTEGVQLLTEEDDETFALVLSFEPASAGIPIQIDGIMTLLTGLCRINYGQNFNPAAVHFSHPKPACAGEFFAYFKCPVLFDAPDNRVILPIEVLDVDLPGANPQLAQVNDKIMIEYLARLDKDDIITRVKAIIIDQLPNGTVVDSSVADSLHMNVRSLQRRLRQKDCTFKGILNEVREQLALKYIKDSRLTLSEISFLLGFSETSSFSRAFKRWTGDSPREYRGQV